MMTKLKRINHRVVVIGPYRGCETDEQRAFELADRVRRLLREHVGWEHVGVRHDYDEVEADDGPA